MFARLRLCLAAALLILTAANAGAQSAKPSVGAAAPSSDGSVAGVPAYGQAAMADPYNRRDLTNQETFGLTASQMLGAAAACEQLHADLVSGVRAKASKDSGDEERAILDAAQQHMLDAAATAGNTMQAGEVDCDRVSGAFAQLQQIQVQDRDLAKALDQPDAVSPTSKPQK